LPIPVGIALAAETWPNGTPRRLGLLRDGQPIGAWVSWHDNGEVRARVEAGSGSEPIAWSIFAADGTLRAEGVLAGNDLVDWQTWRGDAAARQDRTPLAQVPPGGGAWSAADLAAAEPPAQAIATWLAELRAPAQSLPAVAPDVASAPAAAVQALPATRVPPTWQPAWTVLEQEELAGYVQDYLAGKAPERVSRKRYEVPKAAQGKPRRRAELEGQPFPVAELKATDGSVVRMADLRGKKRALIVVLRGFAGQVCVYCVAQTEALAQCAPSFAELNMEVLVVYPGPEGDEKAFLQAYEQSFGKGPPPYKVLYDPDLALVDQLGIAGGDLAFPTTIFVDEQGIVRYAYTGQTRADRPAAQDLIKFVRSLQKS
jgi:peroxiredoxin